MKKIRKDVAFGLGIFFGMAATGSAIPPAITGGVLATSFAYGARVLKDKIKPPSPDP
jgi:hypothetical protein